MDKFLFTFSYIKDQFTKAIESGYKIIRCADYIDYKSSKSEYKILVSRVDIDFSIKKAQQLGIIFNELGIKATFFIRLHANEYNPFSFENYRIIKFLIDSGHEIGYHSEIVDQGAIWHENESTCLVRDINVINTIFDIKIKGVASHGGMTGLNNLNFWNNKKPSEFGLLYEAYDKEPAFNLFQESFYISDSSWTYWKCYNKAELQPNDKRSIAEHCMDGHKIIYTLIHPETYFKMHFYE